MNRLGVRLMLSHLLVAVVGSVVTFLLVRLLAPPLFDESLRRAGRAGYGRGYGQVLRQEFASAVDTALAIGVLAGLVVAIVLGGVVATWLARPLVRLRAATQAMARGQYSVTMPRPGTRELDGLAGDVQTLGATLAETEGRRVRLLGEVAHEMRTPLTVIDGYVEGMIDGVLPRDCATLGELGGETRRLRRLAEDLSALSRASEGRLKVSPVAMDLAEVASEAAERLRPQADDAGVRLAIDQGRPVPLRADPDRIAQVVTNLVGSALRATPRGGTVRVGVRGEERSGSVVVADTGEGLAAADLERVFERFYRVGGRRGGESGTGIGLTISRGIAHAHGGTLTASSDGPGHGATFTLTLPR